MPIDMNSKGTLVGLAILYGFCKALAKLVQGESWTVAIAFFLGSAVVGTLITMLIVWVVLAVISKLHLHTLVTNWIMLVGVCLAIITALMFGAG